MVDRGVEVGVVPDIAGEEHRRFAHRGEEVGGHRARLVPFLGVHLQHQARALADGGPRLATQLEEGAGPFGVPDVHRIGGDAGEDPRIGGGGQGQDLVTDGDPDVGRRLGIVDAEEAPQGEVLDREVGVAVGGGDPGAELRVMGLVDRSRHFSTPAALRSASGSSKEQEPKLVA